MHNDIRNRLVLFYADGSKAIGMGHLSRACLLYDYFKANFDLQAKLLIQKDISSEQFLINRNINTEFLKENLSDNERVEALYKIITRERPCLFVLDVLRIESFSNLLDLIKERLCRTIVIIDNTEKKKINADIVLNGNPSQLKKSYSDQSRRYLLGPKYFLMDAAYSHIEVPEPDGEIKRVFLTLGGSDHNDLLFRIVDIIAKTNLDLSILVITSKASGYIDRLRSHVKNLPFVCDLFVDVPGLVKFWERCDLAITAGGNTLFERIASRLPGATICQLKRQMEIADQFQAVNVNCNLGFGPELSDEVLSKKILDFISDKETHLKQYKKAPEVVDGRGLLRLGEEIKILFKDCGLWTTKD